MRCRSRSLGSLKLTRDPSTSYQINEMGCVVVVCGWLLCPSDEVKRPTWWRSSAATTGYSSFIKIECGFDEAKDVYMHPRAIARLFRQPQRLSKTESWRAGYATPHMKPTNDGVCPRDLRIPRHFNTMFRPFPRTTHDAGPGNP